MAGSADEVHRLLNVLLAVESDVALRSLVVRAKCDELRRVLTYVANARAAHAVALQAVARRQEAAHAEARSLENSIGDAVRRARRIRLDMAPPQPGATTDLPREDSNSKLENILAQAKMIRAQNNHDDATSEEQKSTEPNQQLDTTSPVHKITRLEYPRRMKTLLEKIEDTEAAEREAPFHAVFCRKITEQLALRESSEMRDQSKPLRVQIGYAQQVERLQYAYRRLGNYLDAKADPQADAVLKAFHAPSMSSVFPVYCRIKQARAVLGQLHDATKTLAQRLPPRPVLSQKAIFHRDSMLDRLRKNGPTTSEAHASASNRLLLTSPIGNKLTAHSELLSKLEMAWKQQSNTTSYPRSGGSKPYDNVLNEALLSEISNLVLSAFRDAFCEGERVPPPAAIRELMSAIRVAESAIVHKGRRQRSVVQR